MRTRRHVLLSLSHGVNNFFCLVCKARDTQKNPVPGGVWGAKFIEAVVTVGKDCRKGLPILDRKASTDRFLSVTFLSPLHICIPVIPLQQALAGRGQKRLLFCPATVTSIA